MLFSHISLQHHTYMCGMCLLASEGLCLSTCSCVQALCVQPKRQQFPMVSVLRLFRGLGLRGVQIPAARMLAEKGFLWYAPDQRWDARDPAPQGNHWPDWSAKYRANCSDNDITYLKSTLSISKLHGALMWPYLELTEPLNLLMDTVADRVAFINRFGVQITRSFQGGFKKKK